MTELKPNLKKPDIKDVIRQSEHERSFTEQNQKKPQPPKDVKQQFHRKILD
ncbi:hypothetical protein [Listeria floridensis]|uniref:hypothetical protein n=1 Tax=Listeria floridensis TaxID=1494962 RepID=UPI0004BBCA4C|nr:hypothetical protein [Listeria floridensis]